VELRRGDVDLGFQVFLDRLQIHGLLDNFQVMWDAQCNRVNRLFERPGGFMVL
jgi:hypothetical protein